MLADLITKIQNLANVAAKGEIIVDPSNPRRGWLTQNGTKEEITLTRPDVHSLHSSLGSLVRLIQTEDRADAEVFVSSEGVIVQLDGEERRDSAQLPLAVTDRFRKAAGMADGTEAFQARDIWRLLVHTFHDCKAPPEVISALSSLSFDANRKGNQSAGHTVDQMGTSVNRAVANGESIPERFKLEVPAFHVPGLDDITVEVEFSVEVDFDREQIRLGVYPDSIHGATVKAVRVVANRVDEALNGDAVDIKAKEPIPVYTGKP